MVSEIFLNFVTDTGISLFFGLSPTNTVYLFSFFFAVFFALVAGVGTGRAMVGVIAFAGSLFMFSLMGSFPLWVLALPAIILIFVFYYARGGED